MPHDAVITPSTLLSHITAESHPALGGFVFLSLKDIFGGSGQFLTQISTDWGCDFQLIFTDFSAAVSFIAVKFFTDYL